MDENLRQYLFERHSLADIKRWYTRLKHFRYFRAFGGHANDGDSLDLAISYSDENELIDLLMRMGITPVRHASEPKQPVPGRSYSSTEFDSFPSIIPDTKWIEQPGRTQIGDVACFVWCQKDRVMITAGPASWEVTEETVACAEAIEKALHLEELEDKIIDPPKDTDHYLSKTNHPELFSE